MIAKKNLSIAVLSVGIANIALGVGFLYTIEEPEIEQEFYETCFMRSIIHQEREDPSSCPIRALTTILRNGGCISVVTKLFEAFQSAQGISCENYLPWQDKFAKYSYIEGIRSEDLTTPAMWGIDPWLRPFLTFKAVCDEATENIVTLFKLYIDDSTTVVAGGQGCHYSLSLLPIDQLTSFFQGKVIKFLRLAK